MNSADPAPSTRPQRRFKWRTALRLLVAFALAPIVPALLIGVGEWIRSEVLPDIGVTWGTTSMGDDPLLGAAVGWAMFFAFPVTWILTPIGLLFFEKQKNGGRFSAASSWEPLSDFFLEYRSF